MNLLLTVVTFFVLMIIVIFLFFNLGKRKILYHCHLCVVIFFGLVHLLLYGISALQHSEGLYLLFALPLGLLYGPALTILFERIQGYKSKKFSWLHFLPFFGGMIVCFSLFFNPRLRYTYGCEYMIFLCFFSLLHLISYLIFLKSEVGKLFKSFVKESSMLNIAWYSSITLFFVVEFFLVASLVFKMEDIKLYRTFCLLLYVLFLVGLLFLFYTTTEFKSLLEINERNEEEELESLKVIDYSYTESEKKKISFIAHAISNIQRVDYRKKVEYFIQNLAYLDSELNKEKFCKEFDIPYQYIAPFLREEFGKGFNGFVNQLRLSYAAKKLKSDDFKYSMTDLSMACGFSSRASFYRNFQAEYGCTPNHFRLANGKSLPVEG